MHLRTQRLSGRLLARTILLFELQRALVCFVVADLGDLRRQARRLFERQFRQQRLQHTIERAAMTVGAALFVRRRRRARHQQDDFPAPEIGVGIGSRK